MLVSLPALACVRSPLNARSAAAYVALSSACDPGSDRRSVSRCGGGRAFFQDEIKIAAARTIPITIANMPESCITSIIRRFMVRSPRSRRPLTLPDVGRSCKAAEKRQQTVAIGAVMALGRGSSKAAFQVRC